jgi:RHS repeat-associated protein
LTKYINGGGVDNKLRQQTGNDVKYFIADHLGSTNALTDASGAITEQTSYDSFGNATTNLSTRYQFTGREFDNSTGLHYYRARFYDANLGRFISEDPIGLRGGINLYGYVENNPQNFRDPSGNLGVLAVLAVAWVIYEVGATIYDIYDFGDSLVNPCADWWDVGLGGAGLAMGVALPGGNYGPLLKGVKKYGGRRGNKATRDQLDEVRDEFISKNPEYRHIYGGRDQVTGDDIPEEYIPPLGGPRSNGDRTGSSYPDLTFEAPDGSKIRINTVDSNSKGIPTERELDNAYRIYNQTNEPIILISKPKSK